jgi:amidohydrolase
MDVDALKDRVCAAVDARAATLVEASHAIHADPELAFAEHKAHDLLADLIAGEGLRVERSAYGLDTGFVARAGDRGPTVAVLCEYDALPGIGHACGHNIIAAAGLGAGLAAATLADEVGGRVVLLGTPAEEGGGGKILMTEQGALDGVDVAMMVHPAAADLRGMDTLAIHQLRVDYTGVAAHAAAFPHEGRNALDAAVLGYNNVAALRQHIRPEERIHGVFLDAGDRPNIVPAHASAHWYIRSTNLANLADLEQRVLTCLRAGADAAGCTMTYEWLEHPYADMVDNDPLLDLYTANAARLGRTVIHPRDSAVRVTGSTDMGNVSHLVPSMHPMIAVTTDPIGIHTPEFEQCAGAPGGDAAVIDGAKAMAMTIADIWVGDGVLANISTAFRGSQGVRGDDDQMPYAARP